MVARTAYARLSEGEESWCWENRNLMRSERSQLTTPGRYLSLGLLNGWDLCISALPVDIWAWSNLATSPCPLLAA